MKETQISLRKKKRAEGIYWSRSIESPGVALRLWAWLEVPCASVSFSLLQVLAHLCAGFNTRQAFLSGDKDGHWPLPASFVLQASDPRTKGEHHSQNSSLSTENDVTDLAWVTCPFPEAALHPGAV